MRHALPALLLTLLAACAAEPPPAQEFLAWGDMPYCRTEAGCAEQEATVARLVQAMNRTGVPTAIFLGDSKASGEACDEARVVSRPARLFAAFQGAMVYAPGDNEWTDCERPSAARGGLTPATALARLRAAFFSRPDSLGQRPIPLQRQPGVPENQRWQQGQAMFVTLNIPGVITGRPAMTDDLAVLGALHRQNLTWLAEGFAAARAAGVPALVLGFQSDLWHPCLMEHNRGNPACDDKAAYGRPGGQVMEVAQTRYPVLDMLDALRREAAAFPGRVLLLHGDAHVWLDDPTPGDGRGGVIPNAQRFMVPGEHDVRAVRVAIRPDAGKVFSFSPVTP